MVEIVDLEDCSVENIHKTALIFFKMKTLKITQPL
jgi:hypothetical protein